MNENLISGRTLHPAICVACDDVHAVSADQDSHGSVPCPDCGDIEKRRALFARRVALPELRTRDLNPEEREIVSEWRARGFHELDCFRWIEGRRYDGPAMRADKGFQKALFHTLGAWREAWNATEPARKAREEAPERPVRALLPPAPATNTEIPAPPYAGEGVVVSEPILDVLQDSVVPPSERTNEPEEEECPI